MQFKDQLNFVRQHVKKNRMRVFTTVLATTMGCAFLIVLASVAFGLQGSMEEEILTDDRLTKIEVYADSDEKVVNINDLKKLENVQTAYNEVSFENIPVVAKIGEVSGSATVKSTDFSGMKASKTPLSEGKYPTSEQGVVVGYNLAENLLSPKDNKKLEDAKEGEKPKVGIQESLIGKKIMLEWSESEANKKKVKKEFTIEGVTEDFGRFDTSFYMSHEVGTSLMKDFEKSFSNEFLESNTPYTNYLVFATSLETVKALNNEIKDMGFYTYTVSEQLDEMNMIFTALKAGLIFVGTIAVLIASIGIFNTMTMAVSERTREIGVMKAIGASPKLIQRLFIMESAYIGILGTVIAIITSYIISFATNLIIPKVLAIATDDESIESTNIIFSSIPWELVVIASTISIGVAIISGWRPARKATKIDVIQALRQD